MIVIKQVSNFIPQFILWFLLHCSHIQLLAADESTFIDEMIYNVIKHKVWPYQKFVLSDRDLWYGEKIEHTITTEMNIKERFSWWNDMNKVVLSKMSRLRNNVISLLKRKLKGKSKVYIYLFHVLISNHI